MTTKNYVHCFQFLHQDYMICLPLTATLMDLRKNSEKHRTMSKNPDIECQNNATLLLKQTQKSCTFRQTMCQNHGMRCVEVGTCSTRKQKVMQIKQSILRLPMPAFKLTISTLKNHAGTSFYWDPYWERAQQRVTQDKERVLCEVCGTSERAC